MTKTLFCKVCDKVVQFVYFGRVLGCMVWRCPKDGTEVSEEQTDHDEEC